MERQKERKYKKITYSERQKIIFHVCQENRTCAEVAKMLEYSPSTVKMIIKKYREEGKIFQKKSDKEKRQFLEQLKLDQKNQPTMGIGGNLQQFPMFCYLPPFQPNFMCFQPPYSLYSEK